MKDSLFSSALLVEDETQLATALEIALKQLGIETTRVSTLQDAHRTIENFHSRSIMPEFILLDRMLPDGDGLDLCVHLRKQNYSGSILILTASGQIEERVFGLNQGADDYLPKPFAWDELVARVHALARRKMPFQVNAEMKTWQLDESKLRILGPRGWVTLTPLEFKLASRLISQPGSIISRNILLKDVWGFTLLPKTRTVDHFLGRLRKYFEVQPEVPTHFLTIRGAGYKFER